MSVFTLVMGWSEDVNWWSNDCSLIWPDQTWWNCRVSHCPRTQLCYRLQELFWWWPSNQECLRQQTTLAELGQHPMLPQWIHSWTSSGNLFEHTVNLFWFLYIIKTLCTLLAPAEEITRLELEMAHSDTIYLSLSLCVIKYPTYTIVPPKGALGVCCCLPWQTSLKSAKILVKKFKDSVWNIDFPYTQMTAYCLSQIHKYHSEEKWIVKELFEYFRVVHLT